MAGTLADQISLLESNTADIKTLTGRDKSMAIFTMGEAVQDVAYALKQLPEYESNPDLKKLADEMEGYKTMALSDDIRMDTYASFLARLKTIASPGMAGKRRRRGKTLRRRKQRKTRRRRFRGGANEALAQIANDLDSQIPAIVSAHSTNQPMQYTPKVESEVIAAALAAVPVAEAPSGFFSRLRKAVSSKTPEEKVREFLGQLSTNGSYTFSDIVEPESISEHLRALAA
jgi:hypothetical protein